MFDTRDNLSAKDAHQNKFDFNGKVLSEISPGDLKVLSESAVNTANKHLPGFELVSTEAPFGRTNQSNDTARPNLVDKTQEQLGRDTEGRKTTPASAGDQFGNSAIPMPEAVLPGKQQTVRDDSQMHGQGGSAPERSECALPPDKWSKLESDGIKELQEGMKDLRQGMHLIEEGQNKSGLAALEDGRRDIKEGEEDIKNGEKHRGHNGSGGTGSGGAGSGGGGGGDGGGGNGGTGNGGSGGTGGGDGGNRGTGGGDGGKGGGSLDPKDPSTHFFGVMGHPFEHTSYDKLGGNIHESLDKQFQLMKDEGFKSYAVGSVPHMNDPASIARFKDLLSEAKKNDISITVTDWYNDKAFKTPAEAEAYGKTYGAWFAKQFGKDVSNIQIGNEQDAHAKLPGKTDGNDPNTFGGPYYERYLGFSKGMIAGINSVKPEDYQGADKSNPPRKLQTVINCMDTDPGFLQKLKADGLNWDVTGAHIYTSDNANGQNWVRDRLDRMAELGKPVLLTEFNMRPVSKDAGPNTNPEAEARTLTQTMNTVAELRSRDHIIGADIYELLDEPQRNGMEQKFGIFGPNGESTAASDAVKHWLHDFNNTVGDGKGGTTLENFNSEGGRGSHPWESGGEGASGWGSPGSTPGNGGESPYREITASGTRFVDSKGNTFVPRGFDVSPQDALQNHDRIMKDMPGLNMIKLIGRPNDFNSGAMQKVIDEYTKEGVIVQVGLYPGAKNETATSGAALQEREQMYAKLASDNKNNPDVWFSTPNEPNGSNRAIAEEQLGIYRAIREAGNDNIVLLEGKNGYDVGPQHAMTPAERASLKNVGMDLHYYYDGTNPQHAQDWLQTEIDNAHKLGLPVMIGEFGNSLDGKAMSPLGDQIPENLFRVSRTEDIGGTAWAYHQGKYGSTADEMTSDKDGDLTPYGRLIEDWINGK